MLLRVHCDLALSHRPVQAGSVLVELQVTEDQVLSPQIGHGVTFDLPLMPVCHRGVFDAAGQGLFGFAALA
jgi:hypothetical protein